MSPPVPCAVRGCGRVAEWVPRVVVYWASGAGVPSALMGELSVCGRCRAALVLVEDLLGPEYLPSLRAHFRRMGWPEPTGGVVEWEGLRPLAGARRRTS